MAALLLMLACAGSTPEPTAPEMAQAQMPAVEATVKPTPDQPVATEPVVAEEKGPVSLTSPIGDVVQGESIRIAGSAQVFEGHVQIRLTREGERISDATVVTAAAPERGDFELVVPVTPGPLTLEIFTRSAKDGSEVPLIKRELVVEAAQN
ncbi:MAG: hypothetical protein ACI9VR_003094 [Cognaticolwellia sp.]|jgi:hypothetical protein